MKIVAVLLTLSCGLLSAAPELRLATTSVGPIYIASGQNGSMQSVGVTNIGDGVLGLSASANVPWLTPSIGASNAVQIALTTSTLANGQYTGIVSVQAPGAIDAPQNISVTVQIGSAIPNSVDLYVAPGGTAMSTFNLGTATNVSAIAHGPSSGPNLSLVQVSGSFFSISGYTIIAAAPAGTAVGDYSASVVTSGSPSAADNKTIAVTIHVTSLPIATFAPASLKFRLAQGAPAATQAVVFSNSGTGSLSLSAPTLPTWLSATIQGNDVFFTATPGSLPPGVNTASITISSNAANGSTTIPVELDVLTPGPPVAYYQGVLDNALFAVGDPLAPGGIVAVFGEQLSDSVASAKTLPLTTSLGGATVLVNGIPAPIYYASPGQLNFQVPYETASGSAVVEVQRDNQTGNSVSIAVLPAVPRILPLGFGGYGIALLGDNVTFAIPTTPGIASRPATAGVDTVVFYALGFGQTTPSAQDGQASPAGQVASAKFVIGQSVFANTGVNVTPAYVGLTPGSVGLYQINVAIPANAPRGNSIPVYLDMGGGVLSNRVNIAIQ